MVGCGDVSWFFERIVRGCLEEGLIEGDTIFIDASLIEADATSGKVLTRYKLDSPVAAMPGVIDRMIIAGTESGTLYALNPEDM